MTKKKSTKRALLVSALALMMCVSMLIGSTYAWFTDSVTSAGNVIQSGTLEVLLLDADGNNLEGKTFEWVTADGRAQDQILWEPGCTYKTKEFYVKNDGNLALKYEIAINGIVGDAKLLEAIEWSVTAGEEEATLSGWLEPGESSKEMVLTGHMKEEAGNEYQGLTVEGISIAVFATQQTYESDSFDNQYDDIALVDTAAELKEALEAGKNTMLASDIAIDFEDSYIIVPTDADVVLDMNGHDIAATTAKTDYTQCVITVRGKMNVIGNGTASITTGTLNAWSYRSAVFSVEANGELTLNEGVTIVNEGDFDMAFGVDVLSGSGSPVLNINGATIVSPYTGVRLFNNSDVKTTTVNYNSGVVYGATRDIWAQKASSKALPENAIVNIAEGITYETTTQESGGVIYQMDQDVSYVFDADGLADAIAAGGKVVLATDIALAEPTTVPADKAVVLDLNGKKLSHKNTEAKASCVIDNKGELTVKNGTITYEGVGSANHSYGTNTINNSGKLVIDGATLINTTASGSSNAVDNAPGATLTMNGGTITTEQIAVRIRDGASATFNDGVVSGKYAVQVYLMHNNKKPTSLTINGGTFNGRKLGDHPIDDYQAVYSMTTGSCVHEYTTITITGGTFNGNVSFGGRDKTTTETVTITGGTFNGYLGRYLANDGWQDIPKP